MSRAWCKSRCDCLILSPALKHLNCFIPIVNTLCLVARVHRLGGAEPNVMLMPGRASGWAAQCQSSFPACVFSTSFACTSGGFFYNDGLALSAVASLILRLESACEVISQQLLGKRHQVPTRGNTAIFKTSLSFLFFFCSPEKQFLAFQKKALFCFCFMFWLFSVSFQLFNEFWPCGFRLRFLVCKYFHLDLLLKKTLWNCNSEILLLDGLKRYFACFEFFWNVLTDLQTNLAMTQFWILLSFFHFQGPLVRYSLFIC